ncbi:MAG: hypothetical protein AAF902_04070 [Chloroflexota bacterium]
MGYESNAQADTVGGRIWYALLSVLLISLLLLPWLNGITPGTEPLRFFRAIPFPVGNILVACYIVVIGLNLWTMLTLDSGLRLLWYRFILTIITLTSILSLQFSGIFLSQVMLAAWFTLYFAAVGELIFLYSR